MRRTPTSDLQEPLTLRGCEGAVHPEREIHLVDLSFRGVAFGASCAWILPLAQLHFRTGKWLDICGDGP